MQTVQCTGWWEQNGLGRQPMETLRLRFEEHQIVGAGTDVVGEFTLHGLVKESDVTIQKQYIDAHTVDYHGTFDGEGTLQGVWSIFGVGGRWLIKVVGLEHGSAEIQDL
jgi:hypothetical protein